MAEIGSTARFRLLGPVQLVVGERTVPIGGPGVRGLLALLALNVNKVVALDEIIDALWDHDPPATARTIVHGNVSHLRRVLRNVQGEDGARILTSPPGYLLKVDPMRIDVHHARSLLGRAAHARPEAAAALLAEALALWRGPALSGVPDSLRAPELEDLRLAVHGARVDADLDLGRHAELIAELSPIVRANPLAERTAGQLMRALYYAGRRGDALELYRTVSRAIMDSLGVEPEAKLRWVHERILNDDLPPRAEAAGTRGAQPDPEPGPSQLPAAVPSLPGRQADLAWLDGLVGRGDGTVAVVSGTAGIGKSALVVWWAHRVADHFPDGVLFASLRGFDSRHSPLEPAELLTQFLLGLGVKTSQIPERVHERVALYRSLIARRRMLVLLDDARSADQVRPLLPPSSGSMTVVTSRSRLDGLAVSNAAKLRVLGTLAEPDAVQVIEELAGPAALNHELARLCGYLPLALRIAGARLAAGPEWTAQDLVAELRDEHTRLAALQVEGADGGVRAAFDVSFRSLSPEVAEILLQLGAVPGPAAGPHLMGAIARVPVAEARRRLRALAAHNLIAETERDVFASHDLVRVYLRELAETELPAERRAAILDRLVGFYLRTGDLARRRMLRIVDPFDFSGELDDVELPALPSFADAAEWFAAEWPNVLATLNALNAEGRYEQAWRLAQVAHSYRLVSPLLDEWTRMVDCGLRAAEGADNLAGQCWMLIARAAIALTFEVPHSGLADAERAGELAAKLGDPRLSICAGIHYGSLLSLSGEHERAVERLRWALSEAERGEDIELLGQVLNDCAVVEKRAERYVDAIAHQLEALAIDRELGDDCYAVVSLNRLAELNLRIGVFDDAERYAREAIDLAVRCGFDLQEGVLRLTLGRVLRTRGEAEAAREEFATALRIYERANPKLTGTVRVELTGPD
ncbi:BTAD domain-containing putative transcriptional regulator [Amycolatopsis sp. NPDC059027]|uniref:AfsR/SARP family transcriptional regulator n=1 Tax=unclassified Amycolatopsis TaxID=2618356 RepID=UPI00366E6749